MRRVINELGSDEVKRTGGSKIGDFGTGGRTYVQYSRREAGGGNGSNRAGKLILFCSFLLGFWVLGSTERNHYFTVGAIPEARNSNVYGGTTKVDPKYHDKLVFANTSLSHEPVLDNSSNQVLKDPVFQVEVRNVAKDATLTRVTEYCQWQEIEKRNTIKVGAEPDFCSSSSSESGCENARCSSKGSQSNCESSSGCCAWRKGADIYKTEISYVYHKAWRKYRINSLAFDNPAAYHNPSRDPFPSTEFWAYGTVDISGGLHGAEGLHVSLEDVKSILMPPRPEYLGKSHAENIGSEALNQGFYETSHLHFYSRRPKDGWDHPLLQAAAAYVVDGVVDVNSLGKASGVEALAAHVGLDWITKGTCDAGDIRVSFETRSLPKEMSVLGLQRPPNVIVSHKYVNGAELLFLDAVSCSLESLLDSLVTKQTWKTNAYRALAAFITAVGMYFGAEEVFGASNGWLHTLIRFVSYFSLAQTAIWLFLYGLCPSTLALSGVFAVGIVILYYYFSKPSDYPPKNGKEL